MRVEQFVEDQVFSPALVAEELRTSNYVHAYLDHVRDGGYA